MSNRTLVEFNHDYSKEIRENVAEIMADLDGYLRALGAERFNAKWAHHGVRIKHTRHHSEPCPTEAK
jgi:hypothetical protein